MSQNQKNPKIWEINGVALELDLEDAEALERYEAAFERMSRAENAIPKDGRASGIVRAYCGMFRGLFRDIFGENADAIFDGVPVNARRYDEIYENFLLFVKAQQEAAAGQRRELMARYRPNRAQRRTAARKK